MRKILRCAGMLWSQDRLRKLYVCALNGGFMQRASGKRNTRLTMSIRHLRKINYKSTNNLFLLP
jgi:hypothetical protein